MCPKRARDVWTCLKPKREVEYGREVYLQGGIPLYPFCGWVYGESDVTEGMVTSCFQRIGPDQNQEGFQDVRSSLSDISGLELDLTLHKEVVAKLSLEGLVENEIGRETVGNKVAQDVSHL